MAHTLRIDHAIIDTNTITGWTVLGNDTTTLANAANCVMGTGSISFAKVDGAANTKLAGIYQDEISPVIRLDRQSPNDEIVWYVYVSATTNVDYSFVRIGTDDSNYIEYRYQDDDITAARWQRCHVPIHEHTVSALAGTGCNFDAIAYIAVGVAFDAETDALAGILIDEICHSPRAITGGSAASGGSVAADVGKVASSAPTLTAGDAVPLSVDTSGGTRVRVDTAQAAHDATAPAQAVAAGARANATADTPDEGDLAQLSVDLNNNLRVRVDQAQAATGATAPAQGVQAGVLAKSSIPTAVTDGQLVAILADLYGRLKTAYHDESSGTALTTDISPALKTRYGPESFTQLTAAGSTAARDCSTYSTITYQFVVAAIDTNVVVRVEGSLDASAPTNWFNLNDAGVDTTIDANGTYQMSKYGVACNYVRFTFVSEAGGANATIDVDLMMGH